MIIRSAVFVKSSDQLRHCPKPVFPEYAFIGRSNVGKSTLINTLVGKKDLAKTSNTPGKTRLINHFLINDEWYLVDLPGLGYAKVSQQDRRKWQILIVEYLSKRKNLLNTFMLIDIRIEPQVIDIAFMTELSVQKIPFSIIFTKTDKLNLNKLNRNIETYRKKLATLWPELPAILMTSAITKVGREEILNYIFETNKKFYC